uniref:Uncharacterized protein n=1 Tax=Glossina palpalis gambiensis TaxID=67801 RepID=A0A1B0C407_9MUSC
MADGMLIYSCREILREAMTGHNRKFKLLLERCGRWSCKLNKTKMSLCKPRVKFYGHNLSDKEFQLDNWEIDVIDKADL